MAQRVSTRRRTKTVEIIKTEVIGPLVFACQPVPRVWGGRALSELLGHYLPTDQPYGETWDISGLTEHVSCVSDGPHRGKSLTEIWKLYRTELISSSAVTGADVPLLIKWLDCHGWLSVQVHPDDAMAREVLDLPYGKSEVWIVLHADQTVLVCAGLRPGVTRKELAHHLKAGSAHECLYSFAPQVGDCIVLPAGTVHAAGGGLVMAEVQQSSNATFRLFDWNRLGLDGNPRPLQIELG